MCLFRLLRMQSTIEAFAVDKKDENPRDLVQELLDHRYTNTITQSPLNFCFNVIEKSGKTVKCGGLMKRLKSNFFNDRELAGKIERKRGTSGVQIGIRVHRQIHHLVQCEKTGKCDCTVKTYKRRLSKYTKMLFKKLEALDIRPVATEVPVYCGTGRFCTRLDMIGYQGKSNTPTIVSIKTGYAVGFNRDSRNTTFDKPFDSVSSTSQNINQLQLLGEQQMLEREYGLNFRNCYIIYLGKPAKKKKGSKKKEKEEPEDVYIETPSSWWGNASKDTLDKFYSRLTTFVRPTTSQLKPAST